GGGAAAEGADRPGPGAGDGAQLLPGDGGGDGRVGGGAHRVGRHRQLGVAVAQVVHEEPAAAPVLSLLHGELAGAAGGDPLGDGGGEVLGGRGVDLPAERADPVHAARPGGHRVADQAQVVQFRADVAGRGAHRVEGRGIVRGGALRRVEVEDDPVG